MSDNTIIQQGNFTSTGVNVTLSIRSDFDWIKVYNLTAAATTGGGTDLGYEYYFQRGMANGRGMIWTKLDTQANDPVTVGQLAASTGFFYVDQSGNPLAAPVAITGSTNVVRPIVSTASTAGLATGSIVRLTGMTGQEDLSGYDFAVDTIIANTSFRIASALATAPGAVGTAGAYRIINFNPLFYPRHRFIVNITQAAQAVVTLSVPSGYVVGQEVRVIVPTTSQAGVSDYGMVEINGLIGTVVAVNDAVATQTVTLDIDSSAFTAFTFPTAAKAAMALSKAMLVPIGEDTAYAIAQSQDILSDATDNQGIIGVRLVAGAISPAGQNNDQVYWVAGKSFSVDNQI